MAPLLQYGNPLRAREIAAMDGGLWTLKSAPTIKQAKQYRRFMGKQRLDSALEILHDVAASEELDSALDSDSNNSTDSSSEKKALLPPNIIIKYLKQMETIPRTSYRQDFFKLGMLIEAPLHEEDFNEGKTLIDPSSKDREHSISASHYGYVHTKIRKCVVVAIFARHYVVLPLYSHNNSSLEKKLDKNEYVSIHDTRAEGEVLQLSDHKPLVAEMEPDSFVLWKHTTVHLTYPISRTFHLRVNYLGTLEEDSTSRLSDLFRKHLSFTAPKDTRG